MLGPVVAMLLTISASGAVVSKLKTFPTMQACVEWRGGPEGARRAIACVPETTLDDVVLSLWGRRAKEIWK